MKLLGWLLIAGGAAIVYMDYRHGLMKSARTLRRAVAERG